MRMLTALATTQQRILTLKTSCVTAALAEVIRGHYSKCRAPQVG